MPAPREPRDLAAATAQVERLARAVRVREAATRGIRAVPANPDPAEFPPVPYACSQAPRPCDRCTVMDASCPYPLGRP